MISCPLPGVPDKDFRIKQTYYDNPDGHYTQFYGMLGHGGYDLCPMLPGTRGVLVYAPHDGLLRQYDTGKKGLGKHVIIEDPRNGRRSYLGHFERFHAAAPDGWWIHEHDPVGMTGDATGIHVHFAFAHIDMAGKLLDADNGFLGCIPVGCLTSLWMQQTLTTVGV